MGKVKRGSKQFSIQDIIGHDYHYELNYECRGGRSCSASGCDGICRCYRIDYVKINPPINVYTMVGHWLHGKTKPSELFVYCLERLARLAGMGSVDNYDAHVSGGYYGQEVGKISLLTEGTLVNKVKQLIDKKTEKEQVEFVLMEEYGHLLPKMNNLDYKVIEVNTADVKIPNKEYLVKIDKEKVAQYEEELFDDSIVCVCIKEGNYYTLLDGYHRLAAWKNKGNAKIKIISGE